MLIKQDAQTIHTVVLDDCRNTIEEFVAVARYHAKVEFSQGYRDRVTASRKSLEATIASGVGVYGVNTGFGDNVRYRITEDEMVQLQENILRSHGCSVGRALSGSAIMDESRSLRVQDSMNTRIIPHVHGIAKRMAGQTYDALMEELYAVFDNPIFLPDGTALMGSNWDATAIELYCDSLAIAVMDVAKLTEVHMERLVDPHLSSLVSMTMLTALQAIDLSDHKAMSPVTQKIHDHARQTVTFMENDDLMYQRIEAMEHLVESNQLLADCSVPFTI